MTDTTESKLSDDGSEQLRILPGHRQQALLTEDTIVIRYMKLSTFILLLANKVFIPSLRTLQSMDRLESRVSEEIWPDGYWEQIRELLEPSEKWLLGKAIFPKEKYPLFLRVPGQDHTIGSLRFLGQTWLRELAIRRAIWCWNRYDGESYALWSLYGERGVAVASTVGAIRRALAAAGPYVGIAAPVEYVLPRRGVHQTKEQWEAALLMTTQENLRRPYLFKDFGYRFEDEIRFVFAIHPEVAEGGGAMIDIDSRNLVMKLFFSPKIQSEEKTIIEDLAIRILREKELSLSLPITQDESLLRSFKLPVPRAFMPEEGLPDLFSDLL
jgi:hypothetical protein